MTSEEIYQLFLRFPIISTDSRKVVPDSIFIGIKGDQFDGNKFVADALGKGAAYAITDNPANSDNRSILVNDTIETLQKLASIHRGKITAKIIGITGTNGKTTTKELIGKVLSSTYKTVITSGNFNNHIGVPLTLLSIREDTEFAVIEMGANHPGEIHSLCMLARPHFGIITNIGKAHLEGFGNFEGVIKAKSELYEFIRQIDGTVFVNTDNEILKKLSEGMNISSYSSSSNSDCRGEISESDPSLAVSWFSHAGHGIARTMLYGDYNFENVMAAISIGSYFGITPENIDRSIETYKPENNRSQIISSEHNILLMDAYNANPSSMAAALHNFSKYSAGSKMIILGDMMELGEHSIDEHQRIVALVRKLSFDAVYLIGEQFCKSAKAGHELCFPNIQEAQKWLIQHPVRNMTILLKGSRKMMLENLKDFL